MTLQFPTGDFKDWDDTVFGDVSLKAFIEEMEAELKAKITKVESGYGGWDAGPQIRIETTAKDEYGHEMSYEVMQSEEQAEELATEQVKQELEEEPETFNQDWLKGEMSDSLEHESFIEHAAKDAVAVDGWAHFISNYDGGYSTTKSDWVYWRE